MVTIHRIKHVGMIPKGAFKICITHAHIRGRLTFSLAISHTTGTHTYVCTKKRIIKDGKSTRWGTKHIDTVMEDLSHII